MSVRMAELIDVTIPGQKKSYPLKDITIIGRASTTDIKLDDLMVSRHHARVSRWNEGYVVEDLGSLNGVFLNDARITFPQPLSDSSKICIGPHTLIFRSAESPHPANITPPSSEYTQIIVAAKDHVPAGTAEDNTGDTAGKEAFERLQKNLKVFQEIARAVGSVFDIDALLKEIIKIVFAIFPQAERCFVALQGRGENALAVRMVQTREPSLAGEECVLSQTLARRAIEERRSLLIMNTRMDSQVSVSVKISGASSILCAPLLCPQRTLGILQIESRNTTGEFSRTDLDLFTGIASQVALLIYNAELLDGLKLAKERVEHENKNLKKQQKVRSSLSDIIGVSAKMNEMLEFVKKVSISPYSVLITGESGTGKELIAKAIHYDGSRAGQPFVVLNCAAIPRDLLESELFGHEKGAFTGASETKQGLFEVADKGTIFLDEIGEMSVHTQAKLLRVLQEKELQRLGGTRIMKIDVRILAATNKDLKAAISSGEFREDLFYRLNVVPIHVPPLRERKEDIPLLITHFLASSCADVGKRIKGFTDEAKTNLLNYTWPGNVRELRNVMERIVTIAPADSVVGVEMLPHEVCNRPAVRLQKYKSAGTLYEAQKQLEVEMIMDALKSTEGNKSKAAALLGISRKVLYEKIENYKIL